MDPNIPESAALEDEVNSNSQEVLINMLNDLWNNKNFKVVDDVLSLDCVNRGPLVNTQGIKEFKNLFVLPLFNAFPDLKYVCHEVIQQNSTFVIRWTFSGTHNGVYRGYEPTHKKVFWSGVCINRINTEGKLYDISYYFDSRLLFNQLANAPALPKTAVAPVTKTTTSSSS
ncbi:SnoaL-like polyketide cyclase [Pelomyxa schiedti]|nr:SnoaL-like polyketide cyclase [Pelomyxa schiedti]